jgi:centrosomal protein CEP104
MEFPSAVIIKQIQFLSHQYKITSKIEIYVGVSSNNDPKSFKFKKIGYLGLDPNERSNFQARELKSVYVDYQIQKIKFSLHRCYTNVHNNFSQIGLIAINIIGEHLNKAGDAINMNNFIGGDGIGTKLEEEMNYDPATLKRLKNLYSAKDKAIELEDFDEAKKIKVAIEKLKGVSQQLIQLEERKRIAIKNDDFDAAKMIKYEIERLRNAVSGLEVTKEVERGGKNNVPSKKPISLREEQEYQNDYDDIPMGKEKIKLMPVKKQTHDAIPLTNDMLLEEEDKTNMTKNVNPNQGYKLKGREEINEIINVDNQAIKGISKDFTDLVVEKLRKDGGAKKNKNVEEVPDDDIPANEFKKAEPLIPVLSYDIVKGLFSKYWRNKEDAIKILINEIQNHPHSEIISQHPVDNIITAIMGACANVLNCNVAQALMIGMDMLNVLLNKFRGNNIQGYIRQDFDNYSDQCLLYLIEKVGDINLKLKEKAENTVMEMANNPLIGHKTVFDHLISGQVKKTLVKSARHLSGRLNLISRMIDNYGLNSNDVPIDSLMAYAVNHYKDPNKEIRDAAFNLIMNVFKFIGDGVRRYFKDLRPAQVNALEEGFENLDGLNDHGNNEDDGQEFMNNSQMIYKNREPSGSKNAPNKKVEKQETKKAEKQDNKKTSKKSSDFDQEGMIIIIKFKNRD